MDNRSNADNFNFVQEYGNFTGVNLTDNVENNKKQRKKKLRVLLVILIFIFALSAVFFKVQRDRQIEQWNAQEWFIFSNELEGSDNDKYLTITEIEEYKPKTELYNARIYYNMLSAEEKVIYNAYLYAADNNYIYIYIDDSLIKSKKSALDILVMLSLDSALIQQNLSSIEYKSSQTITSDIMGKKVYKKISGYTVSAENFLKERIERTQEAIDSLAQVDFNFTEKTTDKEKLEEIYEYVQTNLNYSPKYKNEKNVSADTDYLHEAVFSGETNCDGFANTFSVLCHLNGIECFEKVSSGKNKEVGHTWNVVKIDGDWYNVDCTESVNEATSVIRDNIMLRMGYADNLQSDKARFSDVLPPCSKNLIKISAEFNYYGNETVSFVADKLRKNKSEPVIILIKSAGEKDIDNFAQKVANKIYGSVEYFSYEVINGRIVCIER